MLAEEIVVSVVPGHIFGPFWHPGTLFLAELLKNVSPEPVALSQD